jgi:Fe-S-cluster containining protein
MNDLFKKQNFQCNRYCGECCKRFIIDVSREEIKKIKRLGYNDFLEPGPIYEDKFFLKKNNNGCVFLKKNRGGEYSCKIYDNRPKTCRQYPFFNKKEIKSCLPADLYPSLIKLK